MKKPGIPIILIVTVVIAAFTLGFFFGNSKNQPASISVPPSMQREPTETSAAIASSFESSSRVDTVFPININTATKLEFMELPGIGEVLADRIIAYRDSIGGFSTVEGLMNVDGIGEKRIEEMLELITVGG